MKAQWTPGGHNKNGSNPTWVIEYAADRPLMQLNLTASTPASAATLASLAHPLSAESIKLSVSVNGQLKDSGTIAFTANDLKLTNPLKPLQSAQTFFNAMADGSTFEAALALDFGESGRVGLQSQLKAMADEAAADVTPMAEFDKPGGLA